MFGIGLFALFIFTLGNRMRRSYPSPSASGSFMPQWGQ
jgi:hypothetical protein